MVTVACQISDFLKNTGSNSALLPEAPVMLIAVDRSFRFTLADLGDDPAAFFLEQFHATGKNKAFPLFGNAAPVDYLSNNDTNDIIITTDSGKQVFVKYGFMVKNFGSLSGGLCLAKALQSFNNANMAFIEISASGRMVCAQFDDTNFGGIPGFPFAPKTGSADFQNPGRNNFQVSYDPSVFIQKAKILTGDGMEDIIDLVGLIDLKMTKLNVAASSTTTLKFRVVDLCCNEDVAADLPVEFLNVANFVVTDKADSSVKTILTVTLVGNVVVLTAASATFVTGHTYIITVASTDDLFTNDVEGYEIADTLEITIP